MKKECFAVTRISHEGVASRMIWKSLIPKSISNSGVLSKRQDLHNLPGGASSVTPLAITWLLRIFKGLITLFYVVILDSKVALELDMCNCIISIRLSVWFDANKLQQAQDLKVRYSFDYKRLR